MEYVAQKPGNIGLRSQYALRLYSWAKKYVTARTKRISLEQLRKVLGLESLPEIAGQLGCTEQALKGVRPGRGWALRASGCVSAGDQ
jgi:hypothetical protein